MNSRRKTSSKQIREHLEAMNKLFGNGRAEITRQGHGGGQTLETDAADTDVSPYFCIIP